MKEKRNDKHKGLIVVIAIIVILGMFGYFCYNKGYKDSTGATKQCISELNKDEELNNEKNTELEGNSSNVSLENEKECFGTYSGETSGTLSNGLSYNYKYTYTLDENGTYTAKFGDNSGVRGVYVINDNTISFIGKKDIVGPRDQSPYYATSDYVIADDCSYIKIDDGTVSFNLNKQ